MSSMSANTLTLLSFKNQKKQKKICTSKKLIFHSDIETLQLTAAVTTTKSK